MIYFNNDYAEGCHENVLQALIRTRVCVWRGKKGQSRGQAGAGGTDE